MQGIIRWKKLFKRSLAPLGFLTLSSLALMLGDHKQVVDLFTKSLMASLMLLILSQAFQGAQWLEWAFSLNGMPAGSCSQINTFPAKIFAPPSKS